MAHHKLWDSFACALSGLFYTVGRERNMKIHCLAAFSVVGGGYILRLQRMEWGLLILTIFLVLVTETVNTAVEKTVDLVTSEYHPLARLAKNVAAGAVLLSAINAVIMAVIIFGPYLF